MRIVGIILLKMVEKTASVIKQNSITGGRKSILQLMETTKSQVVGETLLEMVRKTVWVMDREHILVIEEMPH